MKTILFIAIGFILLLSTSIRAQEFAPIGTEWYYTMRFFMSDDERFVKIESTKDTIINEKTCRLLEIEFAYSCYFYNEKEFVYQEDSIVYFYSPVVDDFQIMYDLNAKKDSSWVIIYNVDPFITDTTLVTVDSVYTISINGQELLAFDVTYKSLVDEFWSYSSRIIELIGDDSYLFNYASMASGVICDADYPGGLRCYQDNYIGFYSTGIADSCNFVTGINEQTNIRGLKTYPNPFNNSTTIVYNLVNNTEVIITIFNQLGNPVKVIRQNQQQGEQRLILDTAELPAGIYYLLIQAGHQKYNSKMIKSE